MDRSRQFRMLLVAFGVAICAVTMMATVRSFLLSPRHVFPDGTVLKFEKVTWGTHHVFSEESRLRGFLREEFPAGFPLLFSGNTLGVSTMTTEPSVVAWFLHDDPQTGRGVRGAERFALVSDGRGRIFRNEIRGWGDRWPNRFVSLAGYPKDAGSFPVVIADADLRPIWQFTVRNPHPIQSRIHETAVVHR